MSEHNLSQALVLLDTRHTSAELHDVVTSVEAGREQGHRIDVDQIWLDQQYAELPADISIGSERIPVQQLTPEAIEQLGKIELNRYDSVASERLSLREFIFRVPIVTLREIPAPEDQIYRTVVGPFARDGRGSSRNGCRT